MRKQRRLARAVGADHADHRPARHVERAIFEQVQHVAVRAKTLADVLELQHLFAQPRAGRDLDDRFALGVDLLAGQLLVGLDAGLVLLLAGPGANCESTPTRAAASFAAASPSSR